MNPARAGLVLGRRWGPAAAPRAEARGGWEVGRLGEQNLSFEIFAEESDVFILRSRSPGNMVCFVILSQFS